MRANSPEQHCLALKIETVNEIQVFLSKVVSLLKHQFKMNLSSRNFNIYKC